MDSVMMALGSRGMMVEAARQCAKYRKKWRALVHMMMIELNSAILGLPCVLSDRPPELWWIILWIAVDAVIRCG